MDHSNETELPEPEHIESEERLADGRPRHILRMVIERDPSADAPAGIRS